MRLIAALETIDWKNNMVRKLILTFGISVLSLGAAACNTIDGAGEDIESVANEVDEEL